MFRRRGRPGLLGTVARTAVVAGTATATAGAVNRHQQKKAAEKEAYADQQAAESAPPPQQQPVYQAPPQPVYQAPRPPPAPQAPAEEDMVGKITQLAKLRDAGVLSEEEFSAAKAKLLGM